LRYKDIIVALATIFEETVLVKIAAGNCNKLFAPDLTLSRVDEITEVS